MQQQTTFSMIPTQDELAAIDRELRFHPATTGLPDKLTVEQVNQFNRDGYVKGLPVFTPDEIATHRQYFDDLLARVVAEGGDSYSISSAHLKYGPVYDLLVNPVIVSYVADLLGPDVIGWGSHYFCKMPGDGKQVSWHQDASYWPLTPSKTATVWLAIDDADRENACMQFLPGSHLEGHIEWQSSESDEGNVLDQTVTEVDRFGEPVDVALAAGEISIHSDLLLHGSDANSSNRRRCGLTLRYCTADVHAHLHWNQKGVIVRGNADPRLWPGVDRPLD